MKRLLDQELDGLERSLLEAGKDIRSDGSGKARLLTVIAAGALTTATGTASVGHGWKALLTAKFGKITALSLVLAGTGTALMVRQMPGEQPPTRRAEVEHARVVAPSPSEPQEATPGVQEPPRAQTSAARGSPAEPAPSESSWSPTSKSAPAHHTKPRSVKEPPVKERSVAAPPQSDPTSSSSLLAEAQLVERLRRASQGGQAAAFQSLLAEYRQRYPSGQLGPEVNKLERQVRAP